MSKWLRLSFPTKDYNQGELTPIVVLDKKTRIVVECGFFILRIFDPKHGFKKIKFVYWY